jgi:dipeptidyl-peptidase-4
MKGVLRFFSLLFVVAASALSDEALSQLAADAVKPAPIIALSHSGRLVALEEQGAVWLLDAASGGKKLLVRPNASAFALRWSPDDRYLLVTGSLSAVAYEVRSGKRHSVLASSAALSYPDVSPNGRFVSVVRDHNLWLTALDGKLQKSLTSTGNVNLLIGEPDRLYAAEFDVDRHYWWAPDSSAIAYIETEFRTTDHYVLPGGELPHFRLKMVDVNTGQVSNVWESNEEWPYLLRVAWHPDSRRIAFYRLNRLQNTAELCLSGSGSEQIVLAEKDGYWVNAPVTPLFVNHGDGVVLSSERSGERRLSLYRLDGKLVRDLTPAGLEVYRLHPVLDGRNSIYVTGSVGDKQEQHLFRVDLETGEATKLTTQLGWHEVSVSSDGNAYVDRYSSTMTPPGIWWRKGASQPRELLAASSLQKAVANEFFTIKTHDNIALSARLFKPDDFDALKRYPVILYTFSGPRARVVMDGWDGWQMAWNRFMVRHGYLVLAVDVRGSGGYGHLFEEYIHYRFGAQETSDLREVVSFLRRQTYADASRLGIWGCDYGGHTVVHAMLEFPHGFKAGFADSPITEWGSYDAYFTERYLGLPGKRITEYQDSSALEQARRITGDLLVAASADNLEIRPAHLAALQDAMKEAKPATVGKRLHVLNLEGADYRTNARRLSVLMGAMTEFFEHYL